MSDEITTHSLVDGESTRFGSGWYSGVVGILLGAIGLGAVLCLHFPDLLTMPQLRSHYPLAVMRAIVHFVLVAGFILGVVSICLRRQKILGGIAICFTLISALLGGSQVPISGSVTDSGPFLGLDWFLLNLIFWSAVFIPLERLFALHPEQPIFRRGWRTDLTYFFVSAMALQLTTLLTLKPAAIFFAWAVSDQLRAAVRAQPIALQFIEILLVTDLMQYWIHRLFHQIPWLWRIHAIHHSTQVMDWLAGTRLHIVDAVVTRGMSYVPLFVLGFSDMAMAMYVVVVTVQATFIHANVRFDFGLLKYVLATPQFHHWHHGSEIEAIDKNFAVHMPIWDLLFGTYYLPDGKWPSAYGVQGRQPPEGYLKQLVYPFQSQGSDSPASEDA